MDTRRLATLLLVSTAIAMPMLANAQEVPAAASDQPASVVSEPAPAETSEPAPEESEVSIPGEIGEIVITGRRDSSIVRTAPQVVSVLTAVEIARTGEGNIAGALSHVSGLSLVGSGYVYVRGLGDRYSLALLNGSPLPSPEPLKRVVPLDLFPSSIIASSLVQKSYSANFPGEFGGGVINLTTKAIPREPFLSIGFGGSADTETTGRLSYTYYGSTSDWSGYDDGKRDMVPALNAFIASGERISSGNIKTGDIARQLVTGRNAVVQSISETAPNGSVNMSGGLSFDRGAYTLGFIAAGGYSNKWSTREAINQNSLQADLSALNSDFTRVTSDNRIVLNGLVGLGLEFGDNKLRWTNLYIRDTLKHTRLGLGNRNQTTVDFMQQDTSWYERELIDSQVVGEFNLNDNLSVDVRVAYANSKRNSPYELTFEYVRTNVKADPYGAYFVNRLNNGNGGDAVISFSELDEKLWSGGADATYRLRDGLSGTVGYAFADTERTSSRRDFQFQAPSSFPRGVDMLRPDLLLAPAVIEAFNIALVETNEGNPAFLATLRNQAGYVKFDYQMTETLQLNAGVRYETAELEVSPIKIFKTAGASLAGTALEESYWLPAATLTWQLASDMQLRGNLSKTIARPQFRELVYQFYFDPDSNRMYRGNPFLVDSELTNAEARFEWYFDTDQRFTAAAFYKKITNPIESFVAGDDFTTSYANAPQANLIGAEFDAQKYFDLSAIEGDFWASRRIVLNGNYTYTMSELKIAKNDPISVFASSSKNATDFFKDGAQMTGQSDHIFNVQLGLEDREALSQQTLMFNYASKRVSSRGLVNSGQPDIYAYPGFSLDFVARQGVAVAGRDVELKFEARNLTGRNNEEYQIVGSNRVDINTYKMGSLISVSAQMKF